jgi:DNA repair ATPase RecN
MDYCEANDILEELNGVLKHIPYGSKEWSTIISRMAKLQLFIEKYDRWADEQAAKWDAQIQMERGLNI